MTGPATRRQHVFNHDRLLGTLVEVRVTSDSASEAATVDETIAAEIERLERIFSVFDESSELCRWRRGEAAESSTEFTALMQIALDLTDGSEGRFNPLVGELSATWSQAERNNRMPDPHDLKAMAAAIREPRYVMNDTPVTTGDCSALSLNAIAKGFIVDRAIEAGMALGPSALSVNAGGDLMHRGSGSMLAGIENPRRPYDNEPPLAVVELANCALATSGVARRGFRIGGSWFGHVINPLTGWPVDQIASISVLARDATTADGLATVAGVMSPAEAVSAVDSTAKAESLVVGSDGTIFTTAGWPDSLAS